jgi:hypothetical protein
MNTMPVSTIPAKPRVRRTRKPVATTTTPVALMLVAAAYDFMNGTLTLTFDRAIDLAGLDGSQVLVFDAVESGRRYDAGAGVEILSPVSVRLSLNDLAEATGTGVTLEASSLNGIVAAGDGARGRGCPMWSCRIRRRR